MTRRSARILTTGFCLGLLFLCSSLTGLAQGDKKTTTTKSGGKDILGKTADEWLKILRDAKSDVKWRRVALKALEADGAAARTGLFAILEAVEKDPDPQVRRDAIFLLGRLGSETQGALRAIVDALRDPKNADEVREAAAGVMGSSKFAVRSQDYITVLADALKDPHAGTRLAVMTSLRNMGEYAKPVLPAIVETAKKGTEQPLVRAIALYVVSRQTKDAPQTLTLLVEVLLDEKNPAIVREAAIEGLGRSGSSSADVSMALGKTLSTQNIDLRKAAALSLGTLGGKAKAAWPDIKARLMLVKETDKKGFKPPTEQDSTIRNNLIRLAGAVAKDHLDAIPILADLAADEESTENRIAAIQELGDIGVFAKDALPVLMRIAKVDARAAVREAAADAVKQITAK